MKSRAQRHTDSIRTTATRAGTTVHFASVPGAFHSSTHTSTVRSLFILTAQQPGNTKQKSRKHDHGCHKWACCVRKWM
eukprot:3504845-Rhodomonas_salina.1